MTTYYIDPSGGNDSNSGTSEAQAWATWGKIASASAWTNGDSYLGKGGTTARETLTVGESGVTIGSYGTGRHVISGAASAANASWSKTGGRTNVYEFTYTTPSGCEDMVWEDNTRLSIVADVATCDSTPGSFYYSAGTIYAHASDSSDISANSKTYEVPGRSVCLDLNDKDSCSISQIECIRAWSDNNNYGNIKVEGQFNTLTGVVSHDCRRHALQLLDTGANACEGNLIQGGSLYDVAQSYVVSVFSVNGGAGTTGNVINGVDIYQIDETTGLYTEHASSGQPTPTKNNMLYNCHLWGAQSAYGMFFNTRSNAAQIVGCLFDQMSITSSIIFIQDECVNTRITGNVFNSTGLTTDDIIFSSGANATGTEVCGNTFIGSDDKQCARWYNGATAGKCYNNIFSGTTKTINVDALSQTDFESDYNTFYDIQNSTPFTWGATAYNFSDWKTNSSQDTNSVTTDPGLGSDNAPSAHTKGSRWWTGANPIDTNGEPYADQDPSIGPKQFTTIPFHPLNL